MTAGQRTGVASWLREQAELLETRAGQMGDMYCPRFVRGDEEPFSERAAHLRAAIDHENAHKRSAQRIARRA